MRRSKAYPVTPATQQQQQQPQQRPAGLLSIDIDSNNESDEDVADVPVAASRIDSPSAMIHDSDVTHWTTNTPPLPQQQQQQRNHHQQQQQHENAALVRNIASFLSFSDAVSLTSFAGNGNTSNSHLHSNMYNYSHGSRHHLGVGAVGVGENGDNSSWEIGTGMEGEESTDWSWFGTYGQQTIATPLTPALVAVSPGATPIHHVDVPVPVDGSPHHWRQQDYRYHHFIEEENDDEYVVMVNHHQNDADDTSHLHGLHPSQRAICSFTDFHRMEELLQERRRRWAQEKIITAVFSHPQSLRSFCWDAYIAAKEIQQEKQAQAEAAAASVEVPPETQVEPLGGTTMAVHRKRKRPPRQQIMDLRQLLIHEMIDWVFRSVPVSVVFDVLEAAGITIIDTTGASFKITTTTLHHTISALAQLIRNVWDTITHCVTNPFQVLEAIISLQFNAMGKTSEVLASGIQSVATGVGSASNMALYRLSATANMTSSSTASLAGHFHRMSKSVTGNNMPSGESKGGAFNKRLLQKLSAINNAALVVDYRESEDDTCGLTRHAVSRTRRMMHYSVSLRPFVATVKIRPDSIDRDDITDNDRESPNSSFDDLLKVNDSFSSSQEDGQQSPFMCTPQSFPPTPHSRQMVIAQRSQLSDDVVFLARDRLRVHDGLGSDNVRTRERSQALEEGKRLAIFACDKDSGIELTCGKHIATKGGDMYYASARSMVAVLRNCFVYFEFTVLPRLGSPTMATLAIGLSTEEMPPNTLVGAWQSSVGLCTTGQILMAGQWCSPADPAKFSYGVGSTVGCLVCMDDDKAYETWDGVMIKASIRLNVNGVMVSPPVSTLPMSGAPGSLPMSSSVLPTGGFIGRSNSTSTSGGNEKGPISPTNQPGRLDIPAPTLTLLVLSAEDLYPTVTLQSPATSVVCRFSSEDVMATTREMIGAPPGAAVYAIDGSVILNEYEDFCT
jgi:hypothetical protein